MRLNHGLSDIAKRHDKPRTQGRYKPINATVMVVLNTVEQTRHAYDTLKAANDGCASPHHPGQSQIPAIRPMI